jgi:hypothetical protein
MRRLKRRVFDSESLSLFFFYIVLCSLQRRTPDRECLCLKFVLFLYIFLCSLQRGVLDVECLRLWFRV